MYLLSLLILTALTGYLLAIGGFGRKVDQRASSLRARTTRWADRTEDRWRALFTRRADSNAFRAWALGGGAGLLPQEFRHWLAGLSDEEAQHFSMALDEYANSLGFSIRKLVEGELDHDPRMRQVFVEAVVVYSPAYRKVRKAQQAAEEAEQAAAEAEQAAAEAEQKAAEKAPSRRKSSNGAKEPAEVAATD